MLEELASAISTVIYFSLLIFFSKALKSVLCSEQFF